MKYRIINAAYTPDSESEIKRGIVESIEELQAMCAECSPWEPPPMFVYRDGGIWERGGDLVAEAVK